MATKAELAQGLLFESGRDARKRGRFVLLGDSGAGKSALRRRLEEVLRAATEGDERLEKEPKSVLLMSSDNVEELETIRAFVALLQSRLKRYEDSEMESLIEAAMPRLSERPHPAILEQARRNAEFRADFLARYDVLDAEQVHALYGSKADNTAALAGRWRSAERIFGLEYEGRTVYPAFQFDINGKPKAVVARILKALGLRSGWQIASWFTAPSGWLSDDQCPVDVMDTDLDAVVDAARAVTEPNLF